MFVFLDGVFMCACAVMPGKAMLFNSRCETVYDFGTGHRNTASFNPHGSDILSYFSLVCGYV